MPDKDKNYSQKNELDFAIYQKARSIVNHFAGPIAKGFRDRDDISFKLSSTEAQNPHDALAQNIESGSYQVARKGDKADKVAKNITNYLLHGENPSALYGKLRECTENQGPAITKLSEVVKKVENNMKEEELNAIVKASGSKALEQKCNKISQNQNQQYR